jgi:quercetin dioxygenase-like cupin family protein
MTAPQRFETPNATMTTYASPSLTGSDVAVWRAELPAGSSGPPHSVDTEQVVVALEGTPVVTLGGDTRTLAPGDALILPAGAERQISNPAGHSAATLTAALPGGHATPQGKDPVPIPWAR